MRNRRSLSLAWAALALAAIVLSAYVVTLAPGLLMYDSGEFQTLASTLGYTHPTGYPVYLLLAKTATWLPVSDVAYRVNLFSAVCGTIAAVLLFLLGVLLTGRRWLPWMASLALAAAPTFWSQSIIAEVYTPAAAFSLGVLLCLALWQIRGRPIWVFLAGFLGGLSLGVHMSVALAAPAAVIFVALEREQRMRNLLAATAGALTGVLVTVGAFGVLEQSRPPGDYFHAVVEPSCSEWGLTPEEIDSFPERLAFSVSARQYDRNLRRPSLEEVRTQAVGYLRNLPRELPPLVLLAAGAGLIQLGLRNWRFALLLVLTLAAHLAYLATHDMGDIHVAYIPTYVILAIFASALWGARGDEQQRTRPASFWERGFALILLVSVLLPAFRDEAWTPEGRRSVWSPEGEPFRVGYSEKFQRDLKELLNCLENDALLFTEWDLLYPCYYIAHVEQQRTGMMFVQTDPNVRQRKLARSAREFLRQNLPKRPVYFLTPLPEMRDEFAFKPVRCGSWTVFRVHLRTA